MTTQRCPKCGQQATRTDIGHHVCMMGHYWPIGGQKPVVINQIIGGKKVMDKTEKSVSGKHGTCSNCGREKLFIANKEGHCCTCNTAAKGIDPGSAAYASALADVKSRLTDPNHKRTNVPGKVRFKKTVMPKASDFKKSKSTLDMTVVKVARIGNSRIIDIIDTEIAVHMAEVDKLQKAKAIIERT